MPAAGNDDYSNTPYSPGYVGEDVPGSETLLVPVHIIRIICRHVLSVRTLAQEEGQAGKGQGGNSGAQGGPGKDRTLSLHPGQSCDSA